LRGKLLLIKTDGTQEQLPVEEFEHISVDLEMEEIDLGWDITIYPPDSGHPNGLCSIAATPPLKLDIRRKKENPEGYIQVTIIHEE